MDTILVVDDTPENLAVLHDALDEAGYLVLVATSGENAFQVINHNRPDLILLDAIMPGLNGFEIAQRLKENPDTSNIPIIFMTGLTETENVVKAFSHGVIDYVTKPIKPDEVIVRIAAHLKTQRQSNQIKELLDQVDFATVSVSILNNKINWVTKRALTLLENYLNSSKSIWSNSLFDWLNKLIKDKIDLSTQHVICEFNNSKLYGQVKVANEDKDEYVISFREENEALVIQLFQSDFDLTIREAEVLFWLIKGKTNREIGIILGSSHRTVDKHIEHIFEKMHTENRNSAVSMVINNSKYHNLLNR